MGFGAEINGREYKLGETRMIYECDNCGNALPVGTASCPSCGRKFNGDVPADAETPNRGFSTRPVQPKPPHALPSDLTAWLDPTPDAAKPTVRGAGARALLVCAILAVVVLVVYFSAADKSSHLPASPGSSPSHVPGTGQGSPPP